VNGPQAVVTPLTQLVRKSGLGTLLKGPWAFPALGARGGSGASLLVLGVAALLVGLRPGNSVTPEPATGGTETRRPEETRKRGPEGSARPGGLRAPMNDALAFGSRVEPCADQALRLARELLVSVLLPLRSVSPCLLLLVLWAERSPQKKQPQTRRHCQPRRHRGRSQINEDQEPAGRPNALSCAWVGVEAGGELNSRPTPDRPCSPNRRPSSR
jgi:hypothetical protein